LKGKSLKEKNEIVYKIKSIVKFLSEIFFYQVVPLVLYKVTDKG